MVNFISEYLEMLINTCRVVWLCNVDIECEKQLNGKELQKEHARNT